VIHPIRLFGDPCLRRPARLVTTFDVDFERLVDDMVETMLEADGAGLAAPQIGVPLRLFVMTGFPEGRGEGEEAPTRDEEAAATVVVVNPTLGAAQGSHLAVEGCLSLPGLFHEAVPRHASLTLRYQDRQGRQHERLVGGREAVIVQHEADHLEGVLFVDRLPPVERQRFMEEHRSELAEFQREAKAFLREQEAVTEGRRPARRPR
jgi:peptide deformylase